jgi:hypothetical protein
MANTISSTIEVLNVVTSDLVNSFNLVVPAFASNCSPFITSHVLLDGKELDEKWYICCQGCRTPHILNAIATQEYFWDHSKQLVGLSLYSLKPTKHQW